MTPNEYDQWIDQQRSLKAPTGFTDRVIERLDDELAAADSRKKRETRWTLVVAQSISICLAVLIAASRLVDLFSATIAR